MVSKDTICAHTACGNRALSTSNFCEAHQSIVAHKPIVADPQLVLLSQTGKNQEAIGQKYDTGKAPVYQGFIKYFPRAIAAVAMVSKAGADKYAGGKFPTKWREVPDGQNRYADGMVRHMLEEAKGVLIDSGAGGTNCLHLAQEAWNNLAHLELFLQEEEQRGNTDSK